MGIRKMFKFLFFDLDDTIFDFHAAERAALSKTLSDFNVPATEENLALYSRINAAQWRLLEEGRFTREQILVRRYEIFFSQAGISASAADANERYKRYLSTGYIYLPGAREMLERIYKSCEMYLVSNGSLSVQTGRIRDSGIKKYFKNIFISEQIGHNKPAKEFFDACFKEINGFEREKALIIGDSLTSDIRGGNNAGIRTCWFNPHGLKNETTAVCDFEAHSYDDVLDVIGRGRE